jgi:hypothetical protein
MKVLKLWACTANTDTTEGRGQKFTVCYTESQDKALEIVNDPAFYGRYGVMGSKPYNNGEYDVEEETIIILESIEEFKDLKVQQAKEAALKKLTPAERKLLGLE